MSDTQPPLTAVQVLHRQRIEDALLSTTLPENTPVDPALVLSDHERDVIRQALATSTRAVSGFACRLLDIYDELPRRHQYEALDLFANIANNPHRGDLSIGPVRQARELGR